MVVIRSSSSKKLVTMIHKCMIYLLVYSSSEGEALRFMEKGMEECSIIH